MLGEGREWGGEKGNKEKGEEEEEEEEEGGQWALVVWEPSIIFNATPYWHTCSDVPHIPKFPWHLKILLPDGTKHLKHKPVEEHFIFNPQQQLKNVYEHDMNTINTRNDVS